MWYRNNGNHMRSMYTRYTQHKSLKGDTKRRSIQGPTTDEVSQREHKAKKHYYLWVLLTGMASAVHQRQFFCQISVWFFFKSPFIETIFSYFFVHKPLTKDHPSCVQQHKKLGDAGIIDTSAKLFNTL